jgi:CRISPR-associated protein Csx17
MTILRLEGCRSEPLASYLKALAVLRIVYLQADVSARGRWEHGTFILESKLDKDGLCEFFTKDYRPTPIVAPWNLGSGFWEGDNRVGLDALRSSSDPRFDTYRQIIDTITMMPEMAMERLTVKQLMDNVEEATSKMSGKDRVNNEKTLTEARDALERHKSTLAVIDPMGKTVEELEKEANKVANSTETIALAIKEVLKPAKKVRTIAKRLKMKSEKQNIIQACRNRLPDAALEWIDAAVVIGAEGEIDYPPILGTGGNEGHLDYTNNFMDCINRLLIDPSARSDAYVNLANALFGEPSDSYEKNPVGQFDPGRAGGYNQGPNIEQKDFPVNPWNYVLTLEGAVAWSSSIGKRSMPGVESLLKSPFTVKVKAVGYNSSGFKDEKSARAELWTPLWDRAITYGELKTFIAEGRADVGRRIASNTIEFAEAVSSLGVDRGITEFVRYDLLKRHGNNFIAIPAGRFPVTYRRESDLISELHPILSKLDMFLREFKNPPAQYSSARRNIDEAVYDALLKGGAQRLKSIIVAIGDIEMLLAIRDLKKEPKLKRPLSGLTARWLNAADDGTVEFRIARALSSIGPTERVGPIRANLEPVDPNAPYKWSTEGHQMEWRGNSLAARMANLLSRRMMDAARLNAARNPLFAEFKLTMNDIATFIDGATDDILIERLLFGMQWIEWTDVEGVSRAVRNATMTTTDSEGIFPRHWALLKLLFLPHDINFIQGCSVTVVPEQAVLPLLKSGRIMDACEIARRRLFSSGLNPLKAGVANFGNGERIAAALLLPVWQTRKLYSLSLENNSK